jgi:predicted CXXCH cytochrome family protein
MPTLLREVRTGPNGQPEYADKEVAGNRLSLGSDAAADIQLLGTGILPEHAVVSVSQRAAQLRCKRGAQVFVADKPVTSVALQPGVEIVIAGNRLVVFAAPSGFDLALELRYGEGYAASDYERVFRTRLDQTWMKRRPVSWLAILLVLLIFLVIPLHVAKQRNAGHPVLAGLPTDLLWTSGPLLPAHQEAIGDNCGACHQKLFVPVEDSACTNCHQNVNDHVTRAHLVLTKFSQRKPSCESCHREHQEPVPAIIVKDSALCVGCHGKDRSTFGKLDLQSVSGFNSGSHPEFKVHLLQPVPGDPLEGTADAQWRSVPLALAGAKENSNLLFSHKQHLDAARVTKGSGALNCMDCHVMNADGLRFRPITMRDSCISCHDLTFDPLEPGRQLPHGKPREVIDTIEEFYARRYLEPGVVPAPLFNPRLLPNSEDKVQLVKCTDSASSCAQQMAGKNIESLFVQGRGCHSCHQITETRGADIKDRYQVLAVKLGNEFYPHAVFKHSSHLIQGDLKGDAACKSCHAADKSENSSQVLMPGIQKCLSCHSDSRRDTQLQAQAKGADADAARRSVVSLGCVDCHTYHPDALSTQADEEVIASR